MYVHIIVIFILLSFYHKRTNYYYKTGHTSVNPKVSGLAA